MRSLLLAAAAVLPLSAVRAEEPLLLRIRPSDAAGAYDRHEAVWVRSDARARIAIASVCAGCMKPIAPISALPPWRHDATEIMPESGATTAPVPPATLLATAGEP